MKCQECQRKLSAYMDSELSKEEKVHIASHIQSCPECARAMQMLSRTWDTLEWLPEADPPSHFFIRLKARMSSEKKDRKERWIERVLLPASAVAVVGIGIFIGSLVGKNGDMINGNMGVEEEWISALDLDRFDDIPSASLGNAYIELTYLESPE
jgi:anti-sigma factor RsiW